MKNLWCIGIISLCWLSPLLSQQQPQSPAIPAVSCEDQANGLGSGSYIDTVMDQFWPPAFPTGRGITVAVGLSWGSKAFLRAQDDGKYELWLGTAQVPTGNVVDFLEDLANSCRLPPDPANAVKLLNIHWDDKKLTRSQFEQMHSAFMTALSEYFSTVRERSAYFLAKKIAGGGVDAGGYVVICNNSWENLRIDETDLPINGQPTSMIKWVHQFQREVEQAFHGKFVRGKGWTPQ